ncbi:hypothetical protein U8C31_18220 [Sinorhizobium medicae]|uniref:hypothetical protein n=1 Tax=Sinorhizobium medicae TaxID=110321 RepID=UPI002AF6C599|nr:hypothetical protein [Sinorhizobium medicae]WQO72173.1 hypothetical protein U8C31_18220 [Sinorhizobium medicae]
MTIQSVLPSWRFVHSDEMKAESKRFFIRVESMPLYQSPERMQKLATAFANDLPTKFPLIHKADQKCGGCVTEAILHLGRTNTDTRQPGYIYLVGKAFDALHLKKEAESIIGTFTRFRDYIPAPKKPSKPFSLTY